MKDPEIELFGNGEKLPVTVNGPVCKEECYCLVDFLLVGSSCHSTFSS